MFWGRDQAFLRGWYCRPAKAQNWQEARTEDRKIIEGARAGTGRFHCAHHSRPIVPNTMKPECGPGTGNLPSPKR